MKSIICKCCGAGVASRTDSSSSSSDGSTRNDKRRMGCRSDLDMEYCVNMGSAAVELEEEEDDVDELLSCEMDTMFDAHRVRKRVCQNNAMDTSCTTKIASRSDIMTTKPSKFPVKLHSNQNKSGKRQFLPTAIDAAGAVSMEPRAMKRRFGDASSSWTSVFDVVDNADKVKENQNPSAVAVSAGRHYDLSSSFSGAYRDTPTPVNACSSPCLLDFGMYVQPPSEQRQQQDQQQSQDRKKPRLSPYTKKGSMK